MGSKTASKFGWSLATTGAGEIESITLSHAACDTDTSPRRDAKKVACKCGQLAAVRRSGRFELTSKPDA